MEITRMIVQIIGWFSIGGAVVAAGTASWRAYNSDDYFEPSLFYIAALICAAICFK